MSLTTKEYRPSPFDTPSTYMQIDGEFVKATSSPDNKLSLFNIAVVILLAVFTLGFSMILTGKKWWLNRSCRVQPIGIKLCSRVPACYINQPKHSLISSTHWQKICRRFLKSSQLPSSRPPLHASIAIDALAITFLENIREKSSNAIENMALNFKLHQVVQEQTTLDTLYPQKSNLQNKLKVGASLHKLAVVKEWTIQELQEISIHLSEHLEDSSQKRYYCLVGHTPGEDDHHLLIYFQRSGEHYIFNPYQGLLKLIPDQEHSPFDLFTVYCQVQLHEKHVKELCMICFKHG